MISSFFCCSVPGFDANHKREADNNVFLLVLIKIIYQQETPE